MESNARKIRLPDKIEMGLSPSQQFQQKTKK